jgi:thiol:disulfide interchange protein DsbD
MRVTRRVALGLATVVPALLLVPAAVQAEAFGDLGERMGAALDSGSLGMALGIAFLGGVLTSLTPCVYPMIIITVSVFGARQTKTRLEGAALSTVFVLGMAALFTPLGIAAALAGGVHGALLSNPWVLGGLALLFVLLSLSMFGAFEMNLPPALQNRLAQVGGTGYRGAFLLGLVSGVIAAPCTGPVLLALLSWVGTSGEVVTGGASLFVYALGLGLLFWVVGTFAVSLPKSGRWLEWVKSAFGIIMLVMALYYVRDLLPLALPEQRSPTWLASAVGLALAGLAAGAIHLSFHDPKTSRRLRKGGAIAVTVAGAFAAVLWVEALPPGATIEWTTDYERARAIAESEQRPLLVDFGASWCGACGELDKKTFTDPRIVAAARSFVPVKVDLSPGKDTPAKRAILASYQEQGGLPLVVLHGPEGREVARVTQFVEPDEFLEVMKRAM